MRGGSDGQGMVGGGRWDRGPIGAAQADCVAGQQDGSREEATGGPDKVSSEVCLLKGYVGLFNREMTSPPIGSFKGLYRAL